MLRQLVKLGLKRVVAQGKRLGSPQIDREIERKALGNACQPFRRDRRNLVPPGRNSGSELTGFERDDLALKHEALLLRPLMRPQLVPERAVRAVLNEDRGSACEGRMIWKPTMQNLPIMQLSACIENSREFSCINRLQNGDVIMAISATRELAQTVKASPRKNLSSRPPAAQRSSPRR
jgi:hypothetical protein